MMRVWLLALFVAACLLPDDSLAQEHDHQHQHGQPASQPGERDDDAAPPSTPGLPPNVPPLTDADRRAAFPDVEGHTIHDRAINTYVLFDQLEWLSGDRGTSAGWDGVGWIGRDVDRFWFRAEGEADEGRVEEAHADLLYGRAISRWWDLVAGVRQDVRPGPARTWAAIGVQGLAPYWFEVQATAYVGASGRTLFRFETEYELLLTNRLVLQPVVEAEIHGKADPARGIGAGLSTADAGLRVRYEIRREIAPYVGVQWSQKFFGTADAARAAGERVSSVRLAVGLRVWY